MAEENIPTTITVGDKTIELVDERTDVKTEEEDGRSVGKTESEEADFHPAGEVRQRPDFDLDPDW